MWSGAGAVSPSPSRELVGWPSATAGWRLPHPAHALRTERLKAPCANEAVPDGSRVVLVTPVDVSHQLLLRSSSTSNQQLVVETTPCLSPRCCQAPHWAPNNAARHRHGHPLPRAGGRKGRPAFDGSKTIAIPHNLHYTTKPGTESKAKNRGVFRIFFSTPETITDVFLTQ